MAVPEDAWRQATRGAEPLLAPIASGAYVLFRRERGRSPRRDDHRYGYSKRSPSQSTDTTSGNLPPLRRHAALTHPGGRKPSCARDGWRARVATYLLGSGVQDGATAPDAAAPGAATTATCPAHLRGPQAQHYSPTIPKHTQPA